MGGEFTLAAKSALASTSSTAPRSCLGTFDFYSGGCLFVHFFITPGTGTQNGDWGALAVGWQTLRTSSAALRVQP